MLIQLTCRVATLALLASICFAQDKAPEGPFQTVHLTTSRQPGTENILLGALKDLNAAITKGGCKSCIYRLSKAYGEQSGPFTFLWTASWPGRAVYEKIHGSAAYNAAWEKHTELGPVREGEVYLRFVEVKPAK